MRGKGEYHKKIARENCKTVYLAIFENEPVTFMQLYRLLKQQGVVNSKSTLTKCLRRLIKEGKIAKEPACLHLDHPNVLNPPLAMQSVALGRFVNGKFIMDKNAPVKHVFSPTYQPKNVRAWLQKINRLVLSQRKVYVVKLVT